MVTPDAGIVDGPAVFRRAVDSLRLQPALAAAIVDHLCACLPNEGCGLLAARWDGDGTLVGTRFYPGTNVDASPTRFTMAPTEVLAAFRDVEANGWTLGAIVHSHPVTPPTPSPTDLREAFYPKALMVIVSFAGHSPAVRAWRLAAGPARAVAEVPIR
jgi:[CysO sulfur-carrier protein]-S-L-cysteine hydrolase